MTNAHYVSGEMFMGLDECASYARKDILEKLFDDKPNVVEELKREMDAFDRLYKKAKTDEQRMRVRIIYYGRYFIILRENHCI